MSYRRLLILYTFILILVLAQNISLSQIEHASGTAGAYVGLNSHPVAELSLSPEIAKALADFFPMFTADAVTERYGKTLPRALEDIGRGDENGVADIVSEIFGTLNDHQLGALITSLREKIIQERNKPRDKQDFNLVRLAERLNEAALLLVEKRIDKEKKLPVEQQDQSVIRIHDQLKGIAEENRHTLGNPELTKFRQAFAPKFAEVQTKNQDFYKNLECALVNDNDDNACKTALIAGGYDPKLLLRFVSEQCATGNDALCDKMARGLTFKDAQTGVRFFDVVTPTNENQRLIVGTKDFKSSIADLSDQTQGFAGDSIASRQHETFTAIRPRSSQQTSNVKTRPDATSTLNNDPAPARETEEESPKKRDGGNQESFGPVHGTSGRNIVSLQAANARLKGVEATNCFKCHSKDPVSNPSQKIRGGFELNLDGTPKDGSLETAKAVVQQVLVDKSMPPSGPLSDEEQQAFREWAKLKGITTP